MVATAMQKWHELMDTQNIDLLDELLAEDVVFYSPVVHTPQRGKAITKLYLSGAAATLGGDTFKYVRKVYDDGFALLEFETEMDGILVNGVDMISWDENNQITEFKVMVRPLKAINKVHQAMGAALQELADKPA